MATQSTESPIIICPGCEQDGLAHNYIDDVCDQTMGAEKFYQSGNGQLIQCERHKAMWNTGESVGGFRKIPAARVASLRVELAELWTLSGSICEGCEHESAGRV